jgi:hypothetical protein
MWEIADPEGRVVVLEWAGWSHIMRRHPYIAVTPVDVVAVVAQPDRRMRGPGETEEWFYARGLGRSTWLKVVVHYDEARGLVVTAFPRRSFP